MAKQVPVNTMAHIPAPRVVHYLDPTPRHGAVYLSPARLAAREQAQRLAYARWAARQAAIAEHDRKVRRFWLGFGAVVGTAVLAGVAALGWLAWHAITATGLGLLAAPLILLALAGVVVGGRRCITTVQHWH
jgi:hypothetical protein